MDRPALPVLDNAAAPPSAAQKDPVCGMAVTSKSFHSLEHSGRRVYFCSAGCKSSLSAAPAKYPLAWAAAAVYTCPMHSEVRQDRPGACPTCAMALALAAPTLDEGVNSGLTDFKRRSWWTLPMTAIASLLAMFGQILELKACSQTSAAIKSLLAQVRQKDRPACLNGLSQQDRATCLKEGRRGAGRSSERAIRQRRRCATYSVEPAASATPPTPPASR